MISKQNTLNAPWSPLNYRYAYKKVKPLFKHPVHGPNVFLFQKCLWQYTLQTGIVHPLALLVWSQFQGASLPHENQTEVQVRYWSPAIHLSKYWVSLGCLKWVDVKSSSWIAVVEFGMQRRAEPNQYTLSLQCLCKCQADKNGKHCKVWMWFLQGLETCEQ